MLYRCWAGSIRALLALAVFAFSLSACTQGPPDAQAPAESGLSPVPPPGVQEPAPPEPRDAPSQEKAAPGPDAGPGSFSIESCRAFFQIAYPEYRVFFCGMGEVLQAGPASNVSGDSISIYRVNDNGAALLLDMDRTLGYMYPVDMKPINGSIRIEVSTEDPEKDWGSVPLLTAYLEIGSGALTIVPRVSVPTSYDAAEVERLIAEIDIDRDGPLPGDYFSRMYGNLFRLRDFAFLDPDDIYQSLDALRGRGWNDGEVAEVFGTIMGQIEFIRSGTVRLPGREGRSVRPTARGIGM